jgi:hypothetical protein
MANVVKVDPIAVRLQLARLSQEISEYNFYLGGFNSITGTGAIQDPTSGTVYSAIDALAGMESHFIKYYDKYLKEVRDPNTAAVQRKLEEFYLKASAAVDSLELQDETYAGQVGLIN